MPDVVRTVSTRLTIDGEQQYKAAITNINNANNALKASIRLVDEQYKGQANTMAALTEKSKLYASQQALLTQRQAAAQSMYEKAQASVKKYAEEIAKLQNYVTKDAAEEQKLAKQLQTAQENYAKAQNSTLYYSKAVTNAQIEVAKINNSIKDNAKYLEEAKASANGTASSIDNYGKQVKTAEKNTKDFGEEGADAFEKLASALVAAGLIRGIGELVDLFKQAAEASIAFETAFTGVTKTVEGSPAQLAAIKEQMKALSTEIPLTAEELSKIAQIAGQLGIATEDISSFTETIAALTVSTNLSAEQAATQLARFAKITGMQAEEYDNLGAAIVALGNNSAASESEIVDMGMGIAAAGTQVGMTQAQIMAYAAALTSAGMESQAGGTAISRTLIEMSLAAETGGAALDRFAEVAGMSSEAFASLFTTSATDAMNAFIGGLATGGESAIKVLNDMGITEIRQRDAILRLSNASGLLADSVNLSTQAFAENTALTEEAAKFYDTTDSKIQLLKNSVNLLGITIGDQFNPAIREGTETLTEWTDSINEFLQENPAAVQAITGFAVALGVLALAVGGYVVATKIAIPAIVAFNGVLVANPIGAVVVALAALTAGLTAAALAAGESNKEIDKQIDKNKELAKSLNASKEAYDESIAAIESEKDSSESLIKVLDDLMAAQDASRSNSGLIKTVVDQLNASVSGLNLTYNETTGTLNMTTAAIKAQSEAMLQQRVQALYLERQAQVYVELKDVERELTSTKEEMSKATEEQNDLLEQASELAGENVTEAARYSKEAERLTPKIKELAKNQEDLNKKYSEASEEAEYLSGAVNDAGDAVEDASAKIDAAAPSADGLTKSLDAMKTEWVEARGAAQDAADKMAGALDVLDGKAKTTADKLTKVQENQADFWTSYNENIELAKELGLDPEFLASLAATPSEENAQLLDSIVKGTAGSIEKLNAAYARNAEARAEFAKASADAQTAASETYKLFTDDMAAFIDGMDMTELGYANGADSILAILGGMESQLPDFYALVAQVWAEIAKINGATIKLPGATEEVEYGVTGIPIKRNKTGLDYVPRDYYLNYADEGEAILTKQEATAWRSLKASIESSTPSAADMVTMPRQLSANDISGAVGSAMGSIKSSPSYTFRHNIYSPTPLDEYELARQERRMIRGVVRNA